MDVLYEMAPPKPRKPKRTKTELELFLDGLRQDGHSKRDRAAIFKEFIGNQVNQSKLPSRWRHGHVLGSLTNTAYPTHVFAKAAKSIRAFDEFTQTFGKSVEVAIRSGDPAPLIPMLREVIQKCQDMAFYCYKFPDLEYIVIRFNKAHPGRAIVSCNRCGQYAELLTCRKAGRRAYCPECTATMRYCQRCDGLCENEHQVVSIDDRFLRWCDNCAGRAFHWNDGNLHENPMPVAGVGTYHSSQQYLKQIGKTIEGLCSVGFELEFVPIGRTIEERDAISGKLRKLKEIVAGVEEDGSIRPLNGAEIVTNYGALDVVLAGADEISAVLKGKAISHSTNCCGLHVSLGRSGIDQWTLAKFVAFWNASRNRDFLRSFCRRWESGYCKPKSEKGKLTEQMSAMRVPEHIINCHDRRELVNTQNRNRVEVRAFRGTTNAETIKRCISLCVWLMAYCFDSEDRKMRYSGFLDWCKTASRTRGDDVFTPVCLTEFAESKGFLGQDNPRKVILSK